jgi:hypothetical protein
MRVMPSSTASSNWPYHAASNFLGQAAETPAVSPAPPVSHSAAGGRSAMRPASPWEPDQSSHGRAEPPVSAAGFVPPGMTAEMMKAFLDYMNKKP